MAKPFTELLKDEKGNDWSEHYKTASCNVFHTADNAEKILKEVLGRGQYDSKDVIELTKTIIAENKRIKEGSAK